MITPGWRTKGALLEEYAHLESKLTWHLDMLYTSQRWLQQREDGLDAVRDVSWLLGSTGTAADLRRLEATVRALVLSGPGPGRDAVELGVLGAEVLAYSRQAIREKWRRPGPGDWDRLANVARRKIRIIVRKHTEALERDWAEHRRRQRQYDEMEARHEELRGNLGDAAAKVEGLYHD